MPVEIPPRKPAVSVCAMPSTPAASSPSERSVPQGWQAIRVAFRRAGVIAFGLLVSGIGFGIVVATSGLPWWLAPIISAVVFAGSMEFILVPLLTSGASLVSIAVITLLVNSRHAAYALTHPLHRIPGTGVRPWLAKAYCIYSMCDENYAVVAVHRDLRGPAMVWAQAMVNVAWILGAGVGGLAGFGFLGEVPGIDFIFIALFVVLAIDAWRSTPDAPTTALAVGAALLGLLAGRTAMLVVALSVFLAALAFRRSLRARRKAQASKGVGR